MSVRLFHTGRRHECRIDAGVVSCQRLPQGDFAIGLTFDHLLAERDVHALGLNEV